MAACTPAAAAAAATGRPAPGAATRFMRLPALAPASRARRPRAAPCSGCTPTGTGRDRCRITCSIVSLMIVAASACASRSVPGGSGRTSGEQWIDEAGAAGQALATQHEAVRRRSAAPGAPPASSCRPAGRRTAPRRPGPPAAPGRAAGPRASRRFSARSIWRTPARLAGAVGRSRTRRARLPGTRAAPRWRAGRYSTVSGWRVAVARGVRPRRHLEAAHVRRQHHQRPAFGDDRVQRLGAAPLVLARELAVVRAQPQPGRLGHHAAGLGDRAAPAAAGTPASSALVRRRRRYVGDSAQTSHPSSPPMACSRPSGQPAIQRTRNIRPLSIVVGDYPCSAARAVAPRRRESPAVQQGYRRGALQCAHALEPPRPPTLAPGRGPDARLALAAARPRTPKPAPAPR